MKSNTFEGKYSYKIIYMKSNELGRWDNFGKKPHIQ